MNPKHLVVLSATVVAIVCAGITAYCWGEYEYPVTGLWFTAALFSLVLAVIAAFECWGVHVTWGIFLALASLGGFYYAKLDDVNPGGDGLSNLDTLMEDSPWAAGSMAILMVAVFGGVLYFFYWLFLRKKEG